MLNLNDGAVQDAEYKDCRVNLADQILPEVLLEQKFSVLAEYLSFFICVWLRYIPLVHVVLNWRNLRDETNFLKVV